MAEFKLDYTANEINEKLGNITQSDWNASEGEAGHVLNRTHYAEVLLPETTLEVDTELGVALIPQDLALNVGDTPTIVYYGTEYVCTVKDTGDGTKALGNIGAFTEGFPITSEPFMLMYTYVDDVNMGWGILVLDGSPMVKVSIKRYVPIPQNYLTNAFPYYIDVTGSGTTDDPYACKETILEIKQIYDSGRELKLKFISESSEKIYFLCESRVYWYRFATIKHAGGEVVQTFLSANEDMTVQITGGE